MWGTCIPGISYRMMLQTFSASNGMTPWHKSPTLGCVNSVSSRCSHVPEEHRRNHWDEEHENYTWVAMKYFLGKILKCIQFKVFKVKALRKSCVEMSVEHRIWRSCSVHVRPWKKSRCNKGLTFLNFSVTWIDSNDSYVTSSSFDRKERSQHPKCSPWLNRPQVKPLQCCVGRGQCTKHFSKIPQVHGMITSGCPKLLVWKDAENVFFSHLADLYSSVEKLRKEAYILRAILHPLRSGFCRSSMHNPNFRMWPTRKTFHEPRSQKRVTYSGLLRALKIPIVHLQKRLCGKGWKELQMMSSVVFQLVNDGRMQTNHVCLGDVIFIVKNWYVGIVLLKPVAYLACSKYSTHISQNIPQKWERRQSYESEKKQLCNL